MLILVNVKISFLLEPDFSLKTRARMFKDFFMIPYSSRVFIPV